MILHELHLRNFRRFPRLEIDFDPSLTVLVARNGQGKTTVLDAITVALGTFVGAFDHGKAQHIEKSDARYAPAEGGLMGCSSSRCASRPGSTSRTFTSCAS